jgi:hypothetical protein
MKLRTTLPLFLGFALVAIVAAAAEDFKIIRLDDLAKLLDAKTANLYVYDANPQSTRESQGIIPGAKLLPGLAFDPEKTLPEKHDAKLVFYCANTH